MMVTGVNALAETFPHRGLQLSVANLIEVMITESDNTATDVSMGLAGGPAAVTKNFAQNWDHRFQGRSDYPRDSHGFLWLTGGHAKSCR